MLGLPVTSVRGALALGLVLTFGGPVLAQQGEAPLPAGLSDPPPVTAGDAPSVGLRALVVPRHQAMISAGITGRITVMPVRPGESFAKGDTLVSFDCNGLNAELQGVRAEARAAQLELTSRKRQLEFNSIAQLDVDLAQAEAERARAQVAAVAADVEGCTITAPYAGRVVSFEANPYESVKGGDVLLEILDDRTLEVEVIVPSTWLRWLRVGQAVQVELDETGTAHTAAVARIGARVDPASQSVLVTGVFTDPPEAVRPGMSGQAIFARPEPSSPGSEG